MQTNFNMPCYKLEHIVTIDEIVTAVMDCCAAQGGGSSALQADQPDQDADDSPSSSSTTSTQLGFVALAVVCALNTVALVALLACCLRRHLRMRDDDVISVASEAAAEPDSAQS